VLVEGARKVMDGGSEGILWTYRVNGEQVVVIQAAATTRDAMRPDLKIERQGSVTRATLTRRGIRHTVLSEMDAEQMASLLKSRLVR
jgi:hypothetical protein